jgi:hypothetical protein
MLQLAESDLAKLKVNKLYRLPSGAICKINKIDWTHGKVMIHNYKATENQSLDIELAPRILAPMFKIGEVAAMLQRSPNTI